MNEDKSLAHIISELEDIQVRLTCGVDMMVALHTAMEEGSLTPSTARNSLWGIFDYMETLVREMGNRVGDAGDALTAQASGQKKKIFR